MQTHKINSTLIPCGTLPEGPRLILSVDVETRAGHIACIGIASSSLIALCIPLMCAERDTGYWTTDEETFIVDALTRLLTHPAVLIVGQNFLYDAQYFISEYGFVPNLFFDTMFAQGVLFPGLPKGLDFLSSMYCKHHLYWKDEGKEWDIRTMPEEQLWYYNCKDSVKTFEIFEVEYKLIDKYNLRDPFEHKMSEYYPVLTSMIQGIAIDQNRRAAMDEELNNEMIRRETYFADILGHPLNPRSPKQMKELFYDDLKLPVQKARHKNKKGQFAPTLDDEALDRLCKKEPIVWPLIDRIREYRSLGVFLSNFVRAELDPDNRMRCSYNPVGTETMRFNSSANAFGRGTNLQAVPKGDDPEEAAAQHKEFILPEVRRMFVPDAGKIILDWDLERADAQVVAWEADDKELMQMFRERADIHTENAKVIGCSRQMAKMFVHGTNYGGQARTMAINCGITVKAAERAQKIWFAAHPGIKDWHDRIAMQLQTTRSVSNKFGYRRFYFDRIESLLPEALAWIPQSTVACIINRGYVNLYRNMFRDVDVFLQVHDSLVLQIDAERKSELIPRIKQNLLITVPYDTPLVIDVNCKLSDRSWGEVEAYIIPEK